MDKPPPPSFQVLSTSKLTWLLRGTCLALAIILFITAGSSPAISYTWTLTVHLHDHPDGNVTASAPIDPPPADLAAAVRITFTSRDIGQLLTVGRSCTVKEEIAKLSPNRSAIYTPTLRPLIAEVIANPVPPDGATALTPESESAYRQALGIYQTQQNERTISSPPPAREWMRLGAVLLALAAVASIAISFGRARLYRSRGRERLALDQCPHCGQTMTLTDDPRCPACGTDHIQWAIAMNVDPTRAVANIEGPSPPAMPNLPPPPDSPA